MSIEVKLYARAHARDGSRISEKRKIPFPLLSKRDRDRVDISAKPGDTDIVTNQRIIGHDVKVTTSQKYYFSGKYLLQIDSPLSLSRERENSASQGRRKKKKGDLERRKPPVAKLQSCAACRRCEVAQCVVLGRLSSPSIKADY